ncbi:hypothetical protein ABB37_00815 [Leptomonas pyrrhocoris]|uniref:Uncharacterized protein n=1 Tax=Leptomonas pyrrhocoris TaxID=157538 RepID=A0A0N0E0R0_LEPPY|nr:hypothetical protein ABB37_00815 [Leptomonas pyrrhocoris]XP_015665170.1 hypothetical protein ABB37_00815 [Leptomonas pyrrhocoris]KPA86730.1 hypothetical protein ABB37_00815 [Leptomonas pyrrhocoris]KPA86731.1 hypothetical protein ABB37_00815 [Leptomonas pyrrhocoris]|eukprot:XP_015665169.1 hypothetical protein ABB37_00815 [Leptomonas pyrrhocoris]
MGQSQSFEEKLHECVCNNNLEQMKSLIQQPEFKSENVNDHMFVDLVERRWDPATIMAFAELANDHQLAILVSTTILHSGVLPLTPVFKLMKDSAATIRQEHLDELFMTACDHVDTEVVTAMIAAKCFDAADGRAIVTVVRRELNKAAPDEELVQVVLDALPGQQESARYLLETHIPKGKNEATKAILQEKLQRYLK